MFYGSTIKATNFTKNELNNWKVRLIYLVLFFIPKSNPDNEKLYPLVRKWLLEIDEKGDAVREIALDENGKAIFSSPNPRNFGFWTDSTGEFNKSELEPINKDYFEQLWISLNSN